MRLGAFFSDHMVLCSDQPRIAGSAAPDASLLLRISHESDRAHVASEVKGNADPAGRFTLTFDVPTGPGPWRLELLEFEGKRIADEMQIRDVEFGMVWLASGQSNMGRPLHMTGEPKAITGEVPRVRLFSVDRRHSWNRLDELAGAWSVCSPESAALFSAVALFFGLAISKSTPIGLIDSCWGGSPIESWIDPSVLNALPAFASRRGYWDAIYRETQPERDYPQMAERFQAILDDWRTAQDNHRKENAAAKKPGSGPPPRPNGPGDPHTPGVLFNAMIAPLAVLRLTGIIWYQGEANAARPDSYAALFAALITHWRRLFADPKLPFCFVQLPNYNPADPIVAAGWPRIREAQRLTLNVDRTAMAVTIDAGDPQDIHPADKRTVGERLARVASRLLAGRVLQVKPTAAWENGRVLLSLGVPVTPCSEAAIEDLDGFEVEHTDGVWVPAAATLIEGAIHVQPAAVAKPHSVRYAWAANPAFSLCDEDGAPLTPFSVAVD